jgi:hypothetical protein
MARNMAHSTQPPRAPAWAGRIMGGVATGLAVGAGVMAAEAIGRNLMGGEHGSERQPTRRAPTTVRAARRSIPTWAARTSASRTAVRGTAVEGISRRQLGLAALWLRPPRCALARLIV